MNYPMRNNPMFPNQPPVAPNSQRAITPNPSGISTLQQFVNPNSMLQAGMNKPKPTSNYDKLPDEIKSKIEELENKVKNKKKLSKESKEEILNMKDGGDTMYERLMQMFKTSPKQTAFMLSDMGLEGVKTLDSLINMLPMKKGGHAKKQRKRKPYKSSGFVKMKKSKKRKYI